MLNGKYKVIDSHCHVYPDHIAERAVTGVDTRYEMHSVHTGELSGGDRSLCDLLLCNIL